MYHLSVGFAFDVELALVHVEGFVSRAVGTLLIYLAVTDESVLEQGVLFLWASSLELVEAYAFSKRSIS